MCIRDRFNTFQDDIRIRGGRDDDEIFLQENAFNGVVTRFNGRAGQDSVSDFESVPLVTIDDLRNVEVFFPTSGNAIDLQ